MAQTHPTEASPCNQADCPFDPTPPHPITLEPPPPPSRTDGKTENSRAWKKRFNRYQAKINARQNQKKRKAKGHAAILERRAARIERLNAEPKPFVSRSRRTYHHSSHLDVAAFKLGYGNYHGYLLSAHWVGLNARYRRAWPGCACVGCGDRKFQLHHVCYDRLGSERLEDLLPLCGQCHERVHRTHADYMIPLYQVESSLQTTFGWTEAETRAALVRYRNLASSRQ